ncbi:MAG: hypothetical protein GWN62_21815, partial [Aliifodinibius sp.]|nr:hypothetical protein [Fodinibius sp.]
TENIHILYWPIEFLFGNDSSTNISTLTLGSRDDPARISDLSENNLYKLAKSDAAYYLSHPKIKINMGTPHSGSLLLAHALLDKAGVMGFERREYNYDYDKAINKFMDKKIHVIFFIVGS